MAGKPSMSPVRPHDGVARDVKEGGDVDGGGEEGVGEVRGGWKDSWKHNDSSREKGRKRSGATGGRFTISLWSVLCHCTLRVVALISLCEAGSNRNTAWNRLVVVSRLLTRFETRGTTREL